MALFDDEDEASEDGTESESWGVDESADPETTDQSQPLSDLDTASLSRGDPNGTLKRAIDREAGVVIYAYKNGNAGGLSTVPLTETDLVDGNGE